MSMPFVGKRFTFTNPDGTTVDVLGWGDQHQAVFESLDGYTLVKDPESGFFHYASLSADRSALVPTGIRAGVSPRAGLALPQHVRVRREAARATAVAAAPREGELRWVLRRRERKQERVRALGGPDAVTAAAPVVGDYTGLCLLIQFPDVPGTISREDVDAFCNQAGYRGFGNNGSVRDYFFDCSEGRLRYTNVVAAYYAASNPRAYYTDPSVPYGTRARALIVEALDHLVRNGFDFAQLTTDRAGFVRACNVFYAGPTSNNWREGLWPHAWSLAAPYATPVGTFVSDYQVTSMGAELSLGTFCHENGHMICDFPDLYDYGNESRGAGQYCLMAFGGSHEKNPAQIGAYLKREAGWATSATPIAPGATATVQAGHNEFFVHAKSATEYFIIENRQQHGRDVSLPDSGLAIWHVDELGSNSFEQMTPSQHYECALVQADGRAHLEHGVNLGDAEDLFSSPHSGRFGSDTSPASRWWDGSPSGLTLTNISAAGPVMTFSVAGGGVPLYRYYHPGIGDHFYTANFAELGNGSLGYVLERVECLIHAEPVAGTLPLHRYWSATATDHLYTTDFAELGTGTTEWVYEGVTGYVYPTPEPGTIPLYRYWNPDVGDHFYTTNWEDLRGGNFGWGLQFVQCFVLPVTASPRPLPLPSTGDASRPPAPPSSSAGGLDIPVTFRAQPRGAADVRGLRAGPVSVTIHVARDA